MSRSTEVTRDQLVELMAAVPETVALIDPDGTVRFTNGGEKGPGPGGPGGPVGTDVRDHVAPDARAAFDRVFARVLATRRPARYQVPVLDAEGARRWYEGTLTPLVEGDRVTAVAVVTRDVSEGRRAEEQLEALERFVPVCSWCHHVKDGDGEWRSLERYIEERDAAPVTHALCPRCAEALDAGLEAGAEPPPHVCGAPHPLLVDAYCTRPRWHAGEHTGRSGEAVRLIWAPAPTEAAVWPGG